MSTVIWRKLGVISVRSNRHLAVGATGGLMLLFCTELSVRVQYRFSVDEAALVPAKQVRAFYFGPCDARLRVAMFSERLEAVEHNNEVERFLAIWTLVRNLVSRTVRAL